MSSLTDNLDETITKAVQAQIQAKVLEALSGNEFFAQHIHAVLNSPVEVPNPDRSYGKVRIPFIEHVTADLIKKATHAAVAQAIEDEREQIQESVRKAVRRQADKFASDVADGLLSSARQSYGFKVQITTPDH